MTQQDEQQIHTCAKCGFQTAEKQAIANEYKCQQCDYELAHLDIAANGAIRGVFAWLKEAGTEIGGRYQVETVLGKGGFGATYLVTDQRVQGKRWALKEIPEILFDEYEVSLLSQLDHPSIPIIVDRFIDDEMVYLVLKFGGTKTLATECRQQKKIACETLKPWVIQTADVLKYLHNRKPPIIHRDLKPENILIDDEDRIMLIDFGIAKESDNTSATRTLGRAASLGFSPPEQVMGTGTDTRSDIYSFAATIYFALVGKMPVAAHERVAGAVLQSPSELIPDIPADVDAMLMKALSLNINDRPETIGDFLVAFTDNSHASNDSMQSGKTVRISDIQFGPVMNEELARSTPLKQQSPIQQNKKSGYIGIITGVVAITALIIGGGYWLMNNKTDNGSIETLSEQAIPTTTDKIAPTAPEEIASVSTTQQQNKKGTSALEILNKRLESRKAAETEIIVDTPTTTHTPASSQIKPFKPKNGYKSKEMSAILAASEKTRKAKVSAKTKTESKPSTPAKPITKPDWGNQPKGNF